MKYLLIFVCAFSSFAMDKKIRVKIGPTVNAPIQYKNKLYFLATTGNLYESDKKLTKVSKIFNTDSSTVNEITLDGDSLYFGEGLHDSKSVSFYHFSLKTKKIIKKIPFQGHIQRPISFDNERIYIGHGPGGITALNKNTYKIAWSIQKSNKKTIHVDSTAIILKDDVCFNSIYTTKAFICVNKKTGKETFKHVFKQSPKMSLSTVGDYIVGATTKADLMKSKFDIPSTLFFYNTKLKKMDHTKELRGFNFFAPKPINESEFLIAISTGDILTYNIKEKKITFVGEFPEPFISTPFLMGSDLCAIGIMGQLLCYEKGKTQYHITKKKRYFESPIGVIKKIGEKTYIPTRIGYLVL